MSEPNTMDQNTMNGMPPSLKPAANMQDKYPLPGTYQFNGLGSSHSSRNSSPGPLTRIPPPSQVPLPQIPIPASQLPPSRQAPTNMHQLTQNYANMNLSSGVSKDVTPFSSPSMQKFSTSTPLQESTGNTDTMQKFSATSAYQPVTTQAPPVSSQQGFSHSRNSQFSTPSSRQNPNVAANVPSGFKESNNSLSFENKSNPEPPKQDGVLQRQEHKRQDNGANLLIGNGPQASQRTATPVESPRQDATAQQFNSNMQSQYNNTNKIGEGQNTTQPHFFQMKTSSVPNTQQMTGAQLFGTETRPLASQNNLLTQNVPLNQNPNPNQNVNQSFSPQQFNMKQQSLNVRPPLNQGPQQAIQGKPPPPSQPRPSLPNMQQPQPNRTMFPQQNFPGAQPNFQQNLQSPPNNLQQFPPMQPRMPTSLSQPGLQYPQSTQPMPPNQGKPLTPTYGSTPNLFQKMPPPPNIARQPPQQYNSDPRMAQNNMPNILPPQGNMPPMPMGAAPTNMPKPSPINSGSPFGPDKSSLHSNRYPQQQAGMSPNNQNVYTNQQYQNQQNYQRSQFGNQAPSLQNLYNQNYTSSPGVVNSGFNRLWGHENFDLLQCPNILPPLKTDPPRISLGQESLDAANCSPDIFRCTMTKIPETNSLLQKSRLPLGVLIHPFKDLNHLPVIQCNTIVRCRACRTYINPFVFFVDSKRWKCNLCYRVNELPEEFLFDPVSKTYGDPSRRPEVKASTIEYIAPAEYMLRPPQPAIYLFLLDVSRAAVESGYLHTVCNVLLAELKNLPGDARMHIGFLAYDSALHFYNLGEGLSQPHELTVLDIDDVFLPCPDNLLVNLQDRMELVSDLLTQLPLRYNNTFDTGSALGAALQVAHKMMASTGGRVTVFQVSLPTIGPGALTAREDPSQRSASEVQHLNPANDFYKRLALDCSGQQIAVDLFILNSMYVDLATVSGISRFSGGCIHHIPLFKVERTLQSNALERSFKRYLTRKIGFEAVMRIRCTRGLSIHTFHGNFFVRSTDLLSLPNINPDAGFGMQVAIEESLSDVQTVCFQAALLYTSSKGERRIRVHTLCLPIANTLSDIINSADQQCIVGLLSKMAVDRSMQSSLSDAREAFINVAIDILSSYKVSLNMGSGTSGLLAPQCLRLLPLYISALLKHPAFRTGTSTRLDDRVKAMCDMKSKPLAYLMQQIYPDLYPIHNLEEQATVTNDEEELVHLPPVLQLTARNIDSNGAYLLDLGEHMIILVCQSVSPVFLNEVLGVADYGSIQEKIYELPYLDNPHNVRLHTFINYLNDEKPFVATMQIMRDDSHDRHTFFERLMEDRVENALSYHEFLQHLKTQVK